MAQVPTVDAPTQGISGAPLGINAPASAFGANVLGEAAQRTGAVLQHGSDVLEQHAQAQQDLNNKAASDVSYSAFANKANDIQSQFHQLRGADAIAAWPKFQADLETARTNLGQGLNPVASSYYNQETRRIQAGMLSTARGYADAQNQQYVKDSSALKVQSGWQLYSSSPTDENLVNAIGTSKEEYGFQARLELGNSAPQAQIDSLATQKISQSFAATLKGMSGDDPIAAWHLAEQHKDLLVGEDARVIGQLRRAAIPQMAAIDADSVIKPIASGQSVPQSAPTLNTISTGSGKTAQVNSAYAANFQGFISDLEAEGYKINSIGGYANRNVAGTNVPSYHAQGDAIDINPEQNPRGGGSDLPANTAELAAKWGLGWGANWQHNPDSMHFSIAKSEGGSVDIPRTNVPGTPPNSTQFRANMQAELDSAHTLAEQRFPGDAQAGDRALYEQTLTNAIVSRTNHTYEALQANERDQGADILDHIIKGNIQDETQLSSSDRATLSALPPSTQLAVRSTMNSNANQLTDVRQANETTLQGRLAQASTNPQAVLNTDISQFDVTREFKMQFLKAQANLQGHMQAAQESDKTVNRAIASTAFGSTLRSLSIQPGTPEYDHMVGGLKAEIDNFAATHDGKMPTDKDLAPLIAQTAATQYQKFNNYFLGLQTGTSTEPFSDADRAQALKALSALGKNSPNEQDVANMVEQLYIHQRTRTNASR